MKTNLRGKEIIGTTMNGKSVVGIGKRQDNDGVFVALSGYEDEYVEEYVFFENIDKLDGVPPKFASTAMKDEIEFILIQLLGYIGMDIPSNYEDIVQYVYEDILDTADVDNWNHSDVVIGFRRYIESK